MPPAFDWWFLTIGKKEVTLTPNLFFPVRGIFINYIKVHPNMVNVTTVILFVLMLFFLAMYLNERRDLKQANLSGKVLQSKYQSTTVKHGKNWEHFVPFMKHFPGDKNNSVFIGQPIDFISFGEEEITFIEVKTGNSQLSQKQKKIRDLVQRAKVKWREVNDEIVEEVGENIEPEKPPESAEETHESNNKEPTT